MISSVVTGNLGRDAELRDAGSTTVCSFSVASTSKVKGEKVTTWVRCSLFGRRGEALSPYLTKGTKVAVSGELRTHEHNGKTYLELNVSELDLMGGAPRSGGPAPAPVSDDADYGSEDTSDIPF